MNQIGAPKMQSYRREFGFSEEDGNWISCRYRQASVTGEIVKNGATFFGDVG